MLLSELLDLPVHDADGARIGWVVDLRFRLSDDGPAEGTELVGILVSPKSRASYFGYERRDARSPWLLASVIRWRHRRTRLVPWPDVQRVGSTGLTLRPHYRTQSPVLD